MIEPKARQPVFRSTSSSSSMPSASFLDNPAAAQVMVDPGDGTADIGVDIQVLVRHLFRNCCSGCQENVIFELNSLSLEKITEICTGVEGPEKSPSPSPLPSDFGLASSPLVETCRPMDIFNCEINTKVEVISGPPSLKSDHSTETLTTLTRTVGNCTAASLRARSGINHDQDQQQNGDISANEDDDDDTTIVSFDYEAPRKKIRGMELEDDRQPDNDYYDSDTSNSSQNSIWEPSRKDAEVNEIMLDDGYDPTVDYEVKDIMGWSIRRNGKQRVLLSWIGYEEINWERIENLAKGPLKTKLKNLVSAIEQHLNTALDIAAKPSDARLIPASCFNPNSHRPQIRKVIARKFERQVRGKPTGYSTDDHYEKPIMYPDSELDFSDSEDTELRKRLMPPKNGRRQLPKSGSYLADTQAGTIKIKGMHIYVSYKIRWSSGYVQWIPFSRFLPEEYPYLREFECLVRNNGYKHGRRLRISQKQLPPGSTVPVPENPLTRSRISYSHSYIQSLSRQLLPERNAGK